jgi:predicted dehydrogenase
VHAFLPSRIDPESGVRRAVGTPDSVQVLAVLENGARATYHFSGVTPFGQEMAINLYGREGALRYDLLHDRVFGARGRQGTGEMEELAILPEKARSWRVEAEFVEAIRGGGRVEMTDLATGVMYMEFTEAVARSAARGEPVNLPLEEFLES